MADEVTALQLVCDFLFILPEKEGVKGDDEQLSGRTKEN